MHEDSSEPQPITLTIRAYPNGQIELEGPVDNAVLCYGLLEIATDKVREEQVKAMAKRLKHGGLMNFMNGKHK